MKKTKKVVSTILGLLSAFSFKSSAIDKEGIDSEFNNQKGISLGYEMLSGVKIIILLLLGKYSLCSESGVITLSDVITLEQILIDENGEKGLQEFKNNDQLRKAKEIEMKENPSYFLMRCSDKIIKRIHGYFTFENVMAYLYDNRALNTLDETKNFIKGLIGTLDPTSVSMQVIKSCGALELKRKGDVDDYNYIAAISVIRSLFDERALSIINGKLTANKEDFDSIVNTCFLRLENFVNDRENEMKKKYEKNKQGPYNGELKKFYSWMACCLGSGLWKKLYPTKEYDEKEYLRLQEQLCIM